MDFFDPNKKKARTRRLYLGYFLVAIGILLGVYLLLFSAYGYWVDRQGNVYQNGIVFLNSKPGNARVDITNQENTFSQTTSTDDRLALREDTYSFTISRNGYRNWQRTLLLRGGSIERLVYPLLIPRDLQTQNVETYDAKPGLVTQSPNKERLLVQAPGSLTAFELFDTGNPSEPPRNLKVPGNIYPANPKYKNLQLVEWSGNNRHVLVKYSGGANTQYLVLDTSQPDQSFSVNQTFDINPKKATLADKNFRQFYMLSNTNRLVRAQIGQTALRSVANSVVDYATYGSETQLIVQSLKAQKEAQVKILQGDESYDIRTLPKASKYALDIASYNRKLYFVIGEPSSDNIYVYRDPIASLKRQENRFFIIRTLKIIDPEKVSFSENGRFVAAQKGRNFVVYDAEQDRQYRFSSDAQLSSNTPAVWMDGYRLLSIAKGKIVIFDFDGSNEQELSSSINDRRVAFDSDFEAMFNLISDTENKKQFNLTSTKLILD